MKKVLSLLVLIIVLFASLQAQVTFEKTFDFWDNSAITGIYPQADGYILCGNAALYNGPDPNEYFNFIIKTDLYGDTIFTKTYKTNGTAYTNHPLLVTDGNAGFYLAYTHHPGTYLQKLNLEGDSLWSKIISEETMKDFIRSTDGNLVFICLAQGGFQISKTDLEGDLIWTNDIPAIDTIYGWPSPITSLIETQNGNYKLSVNYSDGFGEHHVKQYLFTLDNTGKYIEKKEVFSPMPYPLIHAMLNYDEDIIAIGANDYDRFYISRMNQSGDTIWTRHYLDGIYWGYFNAMTRGSDGNIVMGGMMSDQDNNYVGLFAFTPQGNYLWHKLYATGDQPLAECVALCSDGGYAAGGGVGGWPSEKAYFIKTDANGNISGPGIFENGPVSRLKLYPNPASGLVYLETLPDYQSIEIFDLSGRMISYCSLTGQKEKVETFDLSGFLPGVYLVKVNTNNGVIAEKLVIVSNH
jgi:hypothetical protein